MPHEGPDLANQNNRKLEVLDRTWEGIHSLVVQKKLDISDAKKNYSLLYYNLLVPEL